MISTPVIIGLGFSFLVSVGIPIGALLYFIKIKNKTIKPFFIGMFIFFVSQMLIRVPILTYVLPTEKWFLQITQNPYLYGLFLGLTAGLFEEGGRYLAFKYMLKKNNRWIDSVSYGFGHGGIEAMLLVGTSMFSTLVYCILINKGAQVPELIYKQCTSLSPLLAYGGGFERIFAMIIHIALSIIVFYSVQKRKIIYLGVAILIHTIVNAPLVILPAVFNIGVVGVEVYIMICAIILGIFIIKSKKLFNKNEGGFYEEI